MGDKRQNINKFNQSSIATNQIKNASLKQYYSQIHIVLLNSMAMMCLYVLGHRGSTKDIYKLCQSQTSGVKVLLYNSEQ